MSSLVKTLLRLTPAEAARLWPAGGIESSSLDPQHFEAAIAGSGLTIAQSIELHGEWARVCRGRRNPPHLPATALGLPAPAQPPRLRGTVRRRRLRSHAHGNLWGVYQMIGKLNPRIYVLTH
jgi:hypothetical protein